MADDAPILPPHIEETIRAITKLHADHHNEAGTIQRSVDRLTGWIGRPGFLGVLTAVVLLWVGANLAAMVAGRWQWDPPPFNWLQGAMGLLALYVAVLILVTQRRAGELASRRSQLTLQLAILSEQKSAKIIALLEELRRDSPVLPDRIDTEATEMAVSADTDTVLNAIREGTVGTNRRAS